MAITVDSYYALNFGLSGLPVDAEFPAAALPEQRAIPPTGMPFVGEVDKLLSARGHALHLGAWVMPSIVTAEVLTTAGFTDALEAVQRRLSEHGALDLSPEAAATLRRLGRELAQQLSMRALARENQTVLLAG